MLLRSAADFTFNGESERLTRGVLGKAQFRLGRIGARLGGVDGGAGAEEVSERELSEYV